MNVNVDLYLFGTLAAHRRGAVISDYLSVKSVDSDAELPMSGLLIMFGQEWQSFTQEQQANFLAWLKTSGRTILLIPPFNVGLLTNDNGWQVCNTSGEKSTAITGLAQGLADETRVQFEATSHQFSREDAHSWDDGSLNTLYYKSHSSSGVLAATALPLWSLTCLDIPELVQSWLSRLSVIAGQAKETPGVSVKSELVLNNNHLALLCCAYGHKFIDANSLVSRVTRLGVFSLLADELDFAVGDLIREELFVNGELTDKGVAAVVTSPYQLYAQELKRMPK
ncbi:hypothetical protein [Vibrio crassostreae]|uniref:hypothetical protein n=1 Tax=Vibrio crassostreae TaxID=246167 RepID=UPI00104717DE|nr:hypothetical protein [Vibrio crassostreae]TCW19104.1 hypothetical protein EDB48_106220 [Vibrio crassostreae]